MYLIQETAGGFPIGVFSETSSYFDPKYAKQNEQYGKAVMNSRQLGVQWSDWVNTISDRLPNHKAHWIGVSSVLTPQALLAQRQAMYSQETLSS